MFPEDKQDFVFQKNIKIELSSGDFEASIDSNAKEKVIKDQSANEFDA